MISKAIQMQWLSRELKWMIKTQTKGMTPEQKREFMKKFCQDFIHRRGQFRKMSAKEKKKFNRKYPDWRASIINEIARRN